MIPRSRYPGKAAVRRWTAPLLADPGEAFIYGINIDWLGKVVEAVTGVGLDVAVKQGVTGPQSNRAAVQAPRRSHLARWR